MMRYDPDAPPDTRTWLELPEAERLDAVRRHHKREKARAGSPEVHAIIHVAVETQLAEGHPAATAAMDRLLRDGLDRHEALHAIGSVLAEELFDVVKSKRQHDAAAYARKLSALTASSWRAKYGE
jgi:hypothetical protein